MCQNATMRVNVAWIKSYCVLCSKTHNTLHSCHNFPAGSRQAARVARICETSLLHSTPLPTATPSPRWGILIDHWSTISRFLAATKQLYDWFSPSVRPSVCPSVTPFSPCSHHRIIMKFSGVITNDKIDVHAKGQGQRSKVKVTEVNAQLNRFRTVTPVWIHIWWWNDAYSLMMLRRGALLFFKVMGQISRSHGSKKRRIWPRLGVSGL